MVKEKDIQESSVSIAEDLDVHEGEDDDGVLVCSNGLHARTRSDVRAAATCPGTAHMCRRPL